MNRSRYSLDLRSHMAQCDANYARVMQLLPDLEEADARAIQLSLPGETHRRLEFRVVERCPYTTTVRVTCVPGDGARSAAEEGTQGANGVDGWHPMLPAPRFTLRLYHDARTAEVTEYQSGRRLQARYPYPNAEMRQPDEKIQANRFLAEYLAHCLAHGRAAERVHPEGSLSR